MRTIWNGSISFGLVNIPIGLAVATQRSQSIEILRFVALADVDPVYFDRTYYLAPASTPAARRPYVLLLRAMEETGMAAIGKFVLWGKENLCLIRPRGESLALETLFFAEDVRPHEEIEEAVEETEVKKAELDLARQVIASLVGEFEPAEFENEYRRDLRAMLEAKLAGQEVARPEPVPETPVVDLMDALKKSVAEVQQQREATAKAKPGRKRERAAAPARKSA